MAKKTLLEMVQFILSSMDSDEVNSINDTTEATQVAYVIQGVYEDLIADLQLPEHEGLFQLLPSLSTSQPTVMTVPEKVDKVHWIKYDTRKDYEPRPRLQEIQYVPWGDFIQRQNNWHSDETALSFLYDTGEDAFTIYYKNNQAPSYCSSPDDETIFFDSFDAEVDSTLQKAKTQCYGLMLPRFTIDDTFVPDLDGINYSMFINQAKARAFSEIKQSQNADAAMQARLQRIRSQKNRDKIDKSWKDRYNKLPNMARQSRLSRSRIRFSDSW